MSYRCQICHDDVPRKQPLLRHILYRRNGDIAREIPVCQECKDALDGGMSLANLITLCIAERRWKPTKKTKVKLAPLSVRSPNDREIAKLKAQIAALSGGDK